MKRLLPLLLPALAHASLYGSGGTETVLGDNTAVHTFTESGTFTLSEPKSVRILVVGGGGGGGAECGGGGGGGGVIEDSAYQLAAGTYTITVGAGGIGGREGTDRGNDNERGGNGGDTTVAASDGTILFRAYGGGGGGGWAVRGGVAGGSGGGAAATGVGGSAIDPAQGNAAGNASGGGQSVPSGGGGAGGASATMSTSRENPSGTGGAGHESDISGTTQSYGAGGGGGNYNYGSSGSQAAGGDGIGGFGQGNTSALQDNMKGRDGFGGGGGGGSNQRTYIAGDGGSGVVIIRLSNSDGVSETPVFAVTATQPAVDSVVFTVGIAEAGSGASDGTVSVVAQIAESADAWDAGTGAFSGMERTLATGVPPGTHALRATGLRPSHAYVAKIVVRNDGPAETTSDAIAFTTAALAEERWTMAGRAGAPGLWQFRWSEGANNLDKAFDESSGGLTVQVGAIAAGLSNHHNGCIHGQSYTDASGNVWTIGSNVSYGYFGYMWMEAGTTYTFFKMFYDAVRVEVDGTDVIRDADYNRAKTGAFACTKTGWHRIRVWLTCPGGRNFGVTSPWTFGLGFNTNGVTDLSGSPGQDWSPLENTAEDVFLRTVPTGRTVDIASWALDPATGAATFDAALGAATDETALYAVWGPYHGGDTTNGWAHVARVGTGAIGTAAATASYTVADASDLARFRFVAIDGSGLCSWSPSQLVDLSNPAVAIAGVTHDGDRATVSIRVDSLGTGDFSLRFLWGGNAELSGASVTNVAVSGTGTYDVTIPVTPGATTYYRVEASTTDGGSDVSAVSSFTTLAGSELSSSKNASVDKHWITFSGRVETAGAGTTAVTLWTGESPDALVADLEPVFVTSTGLFTFRRLFPGAEKKIYWKLTSANAGAGGASWTSETAVAQTATSEHGVVYTWKAEVADGDWRVTNNWTTATEGAFGYPAYLNAWAVFPNGSTNRIHLSGYVDAKVRLKHTDGHVTICGDDPATSYLYAGDIEESATLNRSTFALENATFVEYDSYDFELGGASASGSRLVATNGASFLFGGGREAVRGPGAGFTVRSGSAIRFHDDAVPATNKLDRVSEFCHLLFAASGESLTIDDGVFSTRELYATDPADGAGQSFRIRGPGGQLRVTGGVFGDLAKTSSDGKHGLFTQDNPLAGALDVVFEPVRGPFTTVVTYAAGEESVTEAVPLVSVADSGRAFGEMVLDASAGTIRLSVDASSMRRSARSARQHFVLWKSGIDTDHVALVPGEGYTLRYTYGWPSVLTEPENAGDLPTGVWADVPAQAGTLILIE